MHTFSQDENRGKLIRLLSYPAVALVAIGAITFGVSRLKSASPVVDRAAIQVAAVGRGPLVRRVEGLGTLVPEETHWLAATTAGKIEQLYLHPGARVKPDSLILQLSNPDLERQLVDSELATKKSEAELANLRVQLQVQLLNERAAEAQLQSDATQSRLEAERDDALLKAELGTVMNAKISRAHADSLATQLQIEKEKLAISDEARQAQLTAKQAEVAQVQALYALKMQQKEALQVRAGVTGILEEVKVDVGQQIASGANLARVSGAARLMARLHISESASKDVQINQAARIEVQQRSFAGRVSHIDPGVQNGSVNVDVKVDGVPSSVPAKLTVDGTIDVERLPDAVFLSRVSQVRPNTRVALFKLAENGVEAERVMVDVGQISSEGAEIIDGLQAGDKVIVSDMSTWNKYDHILVK